MYPVETGIIVMKRCIAVALVAFMLFAGIFWGEGNCEIAPPQIEERLVEKAPPRADTKVVVTKVTASIKKTPELGLPGLELARS